MVREVTQNKEREMIGFSHLIHRLAVTVLAISFLVVLVTACASPDGQIVVTQEVERIVTRNVEVVVTQEVERLITPTPEPEITDGGTLIMGTDLRAEYPLNPILASNRPALWAFDALTEIDADTLLPAPMLAESWTVSDDGLVYSFKLRQDVEWHDGERFDADDVMFTWDRWLNDPNSQWASDFVYPVGEDSVPATITKIDDYTVEVTLPVPSSTFLYDICCWAGIVPEHLLSDFDTMADATEFNENPVGTGVLVFEELQSQDFVRFNFKKDYWRGQPHLDGFIWKVIPDADAEVTALANGEIDVVKNVFTTDMAARIAGISGVTIYDVVGNFTYTFFFNPGTFEPFTDPLVREAMAYALDKPTIIRTVIGPNSPPAEQMLPPQHWGHNPDVDVIGYDPSMARDLLAEAGWQDTDGDGIVDKDGVPFSFEIMTETAIPELSEVIQSYLREVGIGVTLNIVERAVRIELQNSGEWQAYVGFDGAGVPFTAIKGNWTSGNWTNYSNEEVDRLVQVADTTTNLTEQISAVQEIERILTHEVAAIWLFHYTTRIAVSDNIGGLLIPGSTADLNNTGVFWHLEDLYMKEPK